MINKLGLVLDATRTGRKVSALDRRLKQLVVGQNEAVDQIVSIYQMFITGMSAPGRPIGSFLFLGPTGTGKTRIVEATAEALVQNPRAVIKIDCGEFQHKHEIAKLVGSPPGYLGHRETSPVLCQEVLNLYHTDWCKISFVLFDEIEKASDTLWNLLLGILDKASLTLGDNRKVDFSNVLIFMTSNLGAAEMNAMLAPRIGYSALGPRPEARNLALDHKLGSKISRSGVNAASRKFTPEFMNRLDKIVVFKPLGEPELRQILEIELARVQQRLFMSPSSTVFVFTVEPAAKDYLLEQGTNAQYGARHLKRAIQRLIVQPLSNLIATDQVSYGDLVRVSFDLSKSRLLFFKDAVDLPMESMEAMANTALFSPSTPSEKKVAAVGRTSNRGPFAH